MSEHERFEQLRVLIMGNYHEMPGLQVTVGQAVRLFGATAHECQATLDQLVRRGALCLGRSNAYRLPHAG